MLMLKKIKLYKLVILAIAAFILIDLAITIGSRVAIVAAPIFLVYWGYKKYKHSKANEGLDPETAKKFTDPINDIINHK